MSITVAKTLGLPPGFSFRPDDNELIELYLLPRVRGEPARFPGVAVIEDDSAANTLPWRLLKRHGLADGEDEAYFLVDTTSDAKKQDKEAAARQDRYCDGDGTWVSQRPVSGSSCVAGEEIKWRKISLNLHKGRGKNGSGSTGWVMHEYTVTEPACPFLKICHIAFTGHGKDRKRVPDDESDDCQAGEPVPKRARVQADEGYAMGQNADYIFPQQAALEAGERMLDTFLSDESADQGYGTYYASGDVELDKKTDCIYQELLAEVQACQPRNQEPTIQTAISDQESSLLMDQGISPSNQQLLDGTYLPTTDQEIQDAQLQPVQTSFPFPASADAEFYLEQVPTIEQGQHEPMEHQYGGDQQEQEQERLFWRSIGVDMDNIIF